jgi:hypothetical protein
MVDKLHCPECGFIMMYSIEEDKTVYTCVNTHGAVIKDESDLGPNLDILLEYLKRP